MVLPCQKRHVSPLLTGPSHLHGCPLLEVTHLGGVDIRHDAKPTGGVDLEEEEGTGNARLAKAHIINTNAYKDTSTPIDRVRRNYRRPPSGIPARRHCG